MKKFKLNTPYFIRGIKTFDAEEVLKAGGTSLFSKQQGFDANKLSNLKGDAISESDYQIALSMLGK